MSQPSGGNAIAPPGAIYIIRHGEKPDDPPAVAHGHAPPSPAPPFGVDFQGNQDPHSLLPRGWQRSGALVALFAPALGAPQAGLQTPATLLSPSYGSQDKTAAHRTHQTIQGLSERLGIAIAGLAQRSFRRRVDVHAGPRRRLAPVHFRPGSTAIAVRRRQRDHPAVTGAELTASISAPGPASWRRPSLLDPRPNPVSTSGGRESACSRVARAGLLAEQGHENLLTSD
jgi:hypothetical protein